MSDIDNTQIDQQGSITDPTVQNVDDTAEEKRNPFTLPDGLQGGPGPVVEPQPAVNHQHHHHEKRNPFSLPDGLQGGPGPVVEPQPNDNNPTNPFHLPGGLQGGPGPVTNPNDIVEADVESEGKHKRNPFHLPDGLHGGHGPVVTDPIDDNKDNEDL